MRRQVDWLSASFSRGPSGELAAGVFPAMNVTEDQDNYYVRAELPGLKADELEISVTVDTLAISGERKLPGEDEKAQYHRRERDEGKFSRIVNLPAQIDVDGVKAGCTDGVLEVRLPKAETVKPKRIAVKAS
jgi:HSP20 family protein